MEPTRHSPSRISRGLPLLGALLLAVPAIAAAANPRRGAHFSGRTSEVPPGTLSFAVSHNGSGLTNFRFATLGCLASPGAQAFPVTIKAVPLSKSGSFALNHAKSVTVKHPATGTTIQITVTAKIQGTFTGVHAASGTISYSESISANGAPGPKCTAPKALKFHATG